MVAIPFHAQALVASGPVSLSFTAAGGASLSWDTTPVTGLTLSSGTANTVSVQGAPDLINAYLSSAKLRVGGSGTVAISGAVTGTITVTEVSNASVAAVVPTLNLPQSMTLATSNGQITLPANALGTGSSTANHTRTVIISVTGAGSTPLTAAADASVGLSAETSGNTITLTGTEQALGTYLASAGKLLFNGAAGSYSMTVVAQVRDANNVVQSYSTASTSITAANALALQVGSVSVTSTISGTAFRSSTVMCSMPASARNTLETSFGGRP
jgi:PKD repeat protein